MKKLIAFDLDGTLAESKQAIQPDMADTLGRLLSVAAVAVISGGDWPQFEKQVVSRLPASADVSRLFIMPTTGTKLYRHQDGSWQRIFADDFSDDDKKKIVAALDDAAKLVVGPDEQIWGERIEDRGSQITFSGLGQEAPLGAKSAWDPDQAKRRKMQEKLKSELPGLSINLGGTTSVDITRPGIDKAYAMRKLADFSGIATDDMLFLGDAIYPGGNDDPVRAAGMDVVKVRDPAETIAVLTGIIACLK